MELACRCGPSVSRRVRGLRGVWPGGHFVGYRAGMALGEKLLVSRDALGRNRSGRGRVDRGIGVPADYAGKPPADGGRGAGLPGGMYRALALAADILRLSAMGVH